MLFRSSVLSLKSSKTDSISSGKIGTNDSAEAMPIRTRPKQISGIDGFKNTIIDGPVKINARTKKPKPTMSQSLFEIFARISLSRKIHTKEYTKGWMKKYSPRFFSCTPRSVNLFERIGSSKV